MVNAIMDLTDIDEAIKRAHQHLQSFDEDATEYAKTMDQLQKLYAIRKTLIIEEPKAPEVVVDKDRTRLKDWLPVIGSIGGILVIVLFEAGGNLVTSKSLGFVSKMK